MYTTTLKFYKLFRYKAVHNIIIRLFTFIVLSSCLLKIQSKKSAFNLPVKRLAKLKYSHTDFLPLPLILSRRFVT